MGIPFNLPDEMRLEFTLDQLKSFIKSNVFKDADIEIRNGKIYILLPLDAIWKYELVGDKIVVKIPTSTPK